MHIQKSIVATRIISKGELNPKSKWTLPIATKDGLAKT
jgi:hypothetical protein